MHLFHIIADTNKELLLSSSSPLTTIHIIMFQVSYRGKYCCTGTGCIAADSQSTRVVKVSSPVWSHDQI